MTTIVRIETVPGNKACGNSAKNTIAKTIRLIVEPKVSAAHWVRIFPLNLISVFCQSNVEPKLSAAHWMRIFRLNLISVFCQSKPKKDEY